LAQLFAHADIDLQVRLDALALHFQALLEHRQSIGLLCCLRLLVKQPDAGQRQGPQRRQIYSTHSNPDSAHRLRVGKINLRNIL
ncbi:hypothetical protein, partial [Pseudomonas sp. AU11447]|uniref:hypothetical protein n=1 Tax=Pseudomonas sp. AU11447 TaxID=1843184 RepID=UPI001C45ED55